MKQVFVISLFLTTVGFPILVKADCIFNGISYPTDTEISGLVCQPDGTWKPKP